jgi:cell wall-active antibiotic response 4TMS protein YvqF
MRFLRVLVGVVIVSAGILWLANRLGGVGETLSYFGRWWPMGIVLLGVLNLLAIVRRTPLVAPLLLIAVGSLVLVVLHDGVPAEAEPSVWPVAVIVAGLVVALAGQEERMSDEEVVRRSAYLRSRSVIRSAQPFEIARLRTVLCNLDFDVQQCIQAEAEVHVTVALGHVNLVVPERAQVQLRPPVGLGVRVPHLAHGVPSEERDVIEVSVLGFLGSVDIKPALSPEAGIALEDDRIQGQQPSERSADLVELTAAAPADRSR